MSGSRTKKLFWYARIAASCRRFASSHSEFFYQVASGFFCPPHFAYPFVGETYPFFVFFDVFFLVCWEIVASEGNAAFTSSNAK